MPTRIQQSLPKPASDLLESLIDSKILRTTIKKNKERINPEKHYKWGEGRGGGVILIE